MTSAQKDVPVATSAPRLAALRGRELLARLS